MGFSVNATGIRSRSHQKVQNLLWGMLVLNVKIKTKKILEDVIVINAVHQIALVPLGSYRLSFLHPRIWYSHITCFGHRNVTRSDVCFLVESLKASE